MEAPLGAVAEISVNTAWQPWLPGTWNLKRSTAAGGILVVYLVSLVLCGPQEFLFACSSNGAALLWSVPCPLV